ncbi:DUF4320 family protein, partial [Bacillus thuringiensis]|nr:DUF4320 family protein [Bacillus thuringiensis]
MDGWKYEYTKGRIDHNQSLSFKVKAEHHFFIFKLIGVDGIKAPIWASKDGMGQVYFAFLMHLLFFFILRFHLIVFLLHL